MILFKNFYSMFQNLHAHLRPTLFLLWGICFSFLYPLAGYPVNKESDIPQKHQRLIEFAETAREESRSQREQALQMARERGWPVSGKNAEGEMYELQRLDAGGMPVYYMTDNVVAATSIATDRLWPAGSTGLNLSGSSPFMEGRLGMWDSGRVRVTHREFDGRIQTMDDPSSTSAHSTHVAGTMIAAGVDPGAKGMAFEAASLKAWDWSDDAAEMAEAAPELLVSNHSYGAITGWRYNSDRDGTADDPNWEWWGDINISSYEDYRLGYYNDRAREWDKISYNAPYYLIVKSAGNKRNDNGPPLGEPYWRRDINRDWELIEEREEGAVSSNDGYNIIPTYGNAKNILVVGAVESLPDGYTGPDEVEITTFSSWGPTDDGRIKPDLVADGHDLYSTGTNSDDDYRSSSGTSMSAPSLAGSLFLLQEHYHALNDTFMLSSTLRALACHTADQVGGPGPDYIHGWGLANMERAAGVITNEEGTHYISEKVLHESDTIVKEFEAAPGGPMVITIAWTDPEARPVSYGGHILNNRNPRLINDLDLRVISKEETWKPWVLDVENPSLPATSGDNVADNIEQVVIEDPVPGKTYMVSVSHKGSLRNTEQTFSLIASGVGGIQVCESYAENDRDTRIDGFFMHVIESQTNEGCHAYRDFTTDVYPFTPGESDPFRVVTGTCGEVNDHIVKIFADWNANGEFEEEVAVSDIMPETGYFEGEVSIPGWVRPESRGRIRIVVKETDDVDAVRACGTYEAGETQDYLLEFSRPETDASLEAAVYPVEDAVRSGANERLELKVRNLGQQPLEEVRLNAAVHHGGEPVVEMDQDFLTVIPVGESRVLQFSQEFATLAGKEYVVSASLDVEGDVNPRNDSIEYTFATLPLKEVEGVHAALCEGLDYVTLYPGVNETVFWYDSPSNGELLAVGQATTTIIPEEDIFYAGINTLQDSVGPLSKDAEPWTDGGYHQATETPFITTHVPLTLKAATLYAGWPGEVRIWIEDAGTDQVVSETTLALEATREPASSEVGAANDPEDTGREYQLNLHIPEPGDYRIHISYTDGATLFRNDENTEDPYPYSIPGIMSITGSGAEAPEDFYYWLYNIRVESYGNASALEERQLIEAEVPVVEIQATDNADNTKTLDAGNEGSTFYWNTSDTTQTINVDESGTYSVWVTNRFGCSARGSVDVTIVDDTSVPDLTEGKVLIYPNPAESAVNIESEQPVAVRIYNLGGQLMAENVSHSSNHTLDVSGFPAGIYILQLLDAGNRPLKQYRLMVR